MTDAAYDAMRKDVGAAWLARDIVRANGADTVSYLQGQLSQDVEGLAVGASALSWVLQPHGKVDALVRLTRTGDDEFLIDADAGTSDALLERLNRFKMRTKVYFTALDWKVLALRGPQSSGVKVDGAIASTAHWDGVDGVDYLGEDPQLPAGVVEGDRYTLEALRIESGYPRLGPELDEKTIPAEAGMNNRTVSFTKGCYTGQELVARIDARGGNVPRHLFGVILETSEPPAEGDKIMPVGATAMTKPSGVITSSVFSPGYDKAVALAYIRRDVLPPISAVVMTDDGPVECRVEKLPLIP